MTLYYLHEPLYPERRGGIRAMSQAYSTNNSPEQVWLERMLKRHIGLLAALLIGGTTSGCYPQPNPPRDDSNAQLEANDLLGQHDSADTDTDLSLIHI